MQALVVALVIVSIALIGVILLQRSEGGALGIGGGGGGLVSSRGAGDALTRLTAILAAAFMGISLLLALLARAGGETSTIEEIENMQNAESGIESNMDEMEIILPGMENSAEDMAAEVEVMMDDAAATAEDAAEDAADAAEDAMNAMETEMDAPIQPPAE